MLEIYAWLTSRYADSHHMRESARGWVNIGSFLSILGGVPLLMALVVTSTRADGIYVAIFKAVPQWAPLGAFVILVLGSFVLAYGALLSRAAHWARRSYHF